MQELVVESLVVSLAMVVFYVLVDETTQMPLAERDHACETLLFDRPDEPLGRGVEIGTLRRQPNRLNTGALQDLAKDPRIATLVYQWDVRGGTIEPDDAQTVVWTAPETAVVAWIHVDVTHADGATAGQSAYVRVEVPEPEPEPEPVPALPFLDWAIEWVILQAQSLLRR